MGRLGGGRADREHRRGRPVTRILLKNVSCQGHTLEKLEPSRGSGLADRRVAGKMSAKDLESLRGDTADGPFFWKIGRQRIHPIES